MNFDKVAKIATAILYEGYILYPYRASAIKNRQRWNFGTLYPPAYAEQQRPQEAFRFNAECLLVAADDDDVTIDVKISFLQLVSQGSAVKSAHQLCDPSLAWEEAIERTAAETGVRLHELTVRPRTIGLSLTPAALSRDAVSELDARLTLSAEPCENGACRLRIELQNATSMPSAIELNREQALPLSFVSAHALLGTTGARFISLLDPEEQHRAAASACNNTGVFPVLVGEGANMMLCSPIILYDYPYIAPESEGDFFDGAEMDEMLTLRVLTLTEEEKQQMRIGDPRARRILERTEAMTGDSIVNAHGAIRSLRQIREDA